MTDNTSKIEKTLLKKSRPREPKRSKIVGVDFLSDGSVVARRAADVSWCRFESVTLWHRIVNVFKPKPRLVLLQVENEA